MILATVLPFFEIKIGRFVFCNLAIMEKQLLLNSDMLMIDMSTVPSGFSPTHGFEKIRLVWRVESFRLL